MIKANLGYCCQNLSIPSNFKACTLTRFKALVEKGEAAKLYAVWTHNLCQLEKVIEWNIGMGMKLYRISSGILPLLDFEATDFLRVHLQNSDVVARLQALIKRSMDLGHRYTSHPSRFVSLSSPDPRVYNSSMKSLETEGYIMDLLGLPCSCQAPINIHLNFDIFKKRERWGLFRNALFALPDSVSNRLVIENDDRGSNTVHLIYETLGTDVGISIPITVDFHHSHVTMETLSDSLLESVFKVWTDKGVRPLCHLSTSKTGAQFRAHSDYIDMTQPYVTRALGLDVDLEIEAKAKDLAVLSLKSN